MKLYIKYMVSLRCIVLVKSVLKEMNLHYKTIELGFVDIIETLSLKQHVRLSELLFKSGFELMEDKKAVMVQKIKDLIVEMVHYEEEFPKIKHSNYISTKLGHNYSFLAGLFSELTGNTIEHYIIMHKIEKVKELLIYNKISLTEISYILDYSSVAHLSNQFKKVTGLTPSMFKKINSKRRDLY